MKFSNCFFLNAFIYIALASISLPGKEANFYSSTANTASVKNIEKVKAVSNNTEDVKSELLFRF